MTLARQLGSCFPRFKPCIISLDGLWPQSGHGAQRRRPNRYETSGKSGAALTPSVRHQSVRVCLFVRSWILGPRQINLQPESPSFSFPSRIA